MSEQKKFETTTEVYIESLHGYRYHRVSVSLPKAMKADFPDGTKVEVTVRKVDPGEH